MNKSNKVKQHSPLGNQRTKGLVRMRSGRASRNLKRQSAKPNVNVPADLDQQRIAGIVYAESGAQDSGGEDSTEKLAIKATVLNRAYYAGLTGPNGSRCYNDDFGDGSVLGAISSPNQFLGYGSARWRDVMNGDVMKSSEELNTLDAAKKKHLALCSQIATQDDGAAPIAVAGVGGKPVALNKAANSSPSGRMEKIGNAGLHTFYGFKAGRECQ